MKRPALPRPESMVTRGMVLLFLLFAMMLPGGAPIPPDTSAKLPNIIIIVLDTVRAAATSLNVPHLDTTPNLKRLARSGVVFRDAFSTHDATPPSHFSIFTGLYNGLHSKRDRPDQSIAHHLRRLGYDSLGISSNYNIRKAAIRSTRPFRLFISPVSAFIRRRMPDYYEGELFENATRLMNRYSVPHNKFNKSLTLGPAPAVNAALNRLLVRVRPPALIFANFMDAHDPYLPVGSFHRREPNLPQDFESDMRTRNLPDWMRRPEIRIEDRRKRRHFLHRLKTVDRRAWSLADDLSRDKLEVYKKRYNEEVAYLDSQLEKTLAILESYGFLENSLLIITSDHGESFGEEGYITHSMGNQGDKETSRHVPMLMVPHYAPIHKTVNVDETVSIADIAPTIYDLLGVDDTPFEEIHGDNYGKSRARYLPPLETGGSAGRVNLDATAPALDSAADQEAMMESLKALGYIVDD